MEICFPGVKLKAKYSQSNYGPDGGQMGHRVLGRTGFKSR